ncbi:MAG: alpha/beta hydrolase [Planctomycetes bacterium]|nr:alpha/beta hydrolase [Planctomycetota bacterium]NBY03501.1 alpha/beta hydrolase [Planctomycetota bacterium]
MLSRRIFLSLGLTAVCSQFSFGTSAKKKLLILIEGAGDFQAVAKVLEKSLNHLPPNMELHRFHWSHGYLRIVADQTDLAHISENGEKLASSIRMVQKRNPDTEINIIAHSAGTSVALAGVSLLNENSIERLILLAPSVSKDYPIIPAISAVKDGVHVFYSHKDTFILGPILKFTKTADLRKCQNAAGRYGFTPATRNRDEELLVATKLKQYAWKTDDASIGNDGGHYGAYGQPYLDLKVLPLLFNNPQAKITSAIP